MTTEIDAKRMYERTVQAQKKIIMNEIANEADTGAHTLGIFIEYLHPEVIKYFRDLGYEISTKQKERMKTLLIISWNYGTDPEKPKSKED